MNKDLQKLMNELKTDLTVLKTQYAESQINTNKKLDAIMAKLDRYEERLSNVESKQLVLDSKTNALAVFQMIFSTALSAVAAFLSGGKRI